MRQPEIAILNREGVSLVEVMIALVVMLLVFFALMQTTLVGIDANMLNSLRSEAVNIAEKRMTEVRNQAFTEIQTDTGSLTGCDCPAGFPATGRCEQKNLKSITNFNFCTRVACTEIGGDGNCATDTAGGDNKQVTVSVGWRWKGQPYRHSITTVRKR
jgi:type II secretory pathway pseudopilin PulG